MFLNNQFIIQNSKFQMSAIKNYFHDQIEASQRRHEHKISWLNMPGYKPETWNPIIGCSKVSDGCKNCYALNMAKRIACMERKNDSIDYRLVLMPGSENKQTEWNGHTILRTDKFDKPFSWKSPRMIFVCSMGDLFHEATSFEDIDEIFSVMSDDDQHIYVLLTKRPERILEFFTWKILNTHTNWRPKDNIWFGITAENQQEAKRRLPYFNLFYAAVKFVSIEPMLSEINFSELLSETLKWHAGGLKNCISWVIAGGESGPKARPMHPDWVRSVRDQCAAAGVPFFFKQWGEWIEKENEEEKVKRETLLDINGKRYVWISRKEGAILNIKWMKKIGRKSAGDLLDGKQHHEWPKLATQTSQPETV